MKISKQNFPMLAFNAAVRLGAANLERGTVLTRAMKVLVKRTNAHLQIPR